MSPEATPSPPPEPAALVEHKISKPTLFISHASSDGEFANAIKQEIEKVFANGVSVYCTSSPGAIGAGSDWLADIEHKLSVAQAVIAVVTPVSIERPWLWFEVGATWSKGRSGVCRIYPLCVAEVNPSDLPSPLDRLQALSLAKATDLMLLFQALIDQFGFGKISSFRASNISGRVPKYANVKVVPVDLGERVFYSGKYTGYTDDELREVIDTQLFLPDAAKFDSSLSLYRGREDLIHNGKLIHFRQVDQRLDLPLGSSKRLLNSVASRYGLFPALESDNVVRYAADDKE
jgi:hypothetical protein